MSRSDSSHHYGLSPLAGVTAGTAGVLFLFGVLALAWHQVSGHVSLALTLAFYAVAVVLTAALAVTFGAGTWLVVIWVAHRHRNPELLVRQPAVTAEVADGELVPQEAIVQSPAPAAIEPPRVSLNLTDAQLDALMQHIGKQDR